MTQHGCYLLLLKLDILGFTLDETCLFIMYGN